MPDMANGFLKKLLSNTGRLYKTIVADRNKNVSDPDPASKFANSDPDPTQTKKMSTHNKILTYFLKLKPSKLTIYKTSKLTIYKTSKDI